MGCEKEIEKKYIVKELPENLSEYPHKEIEQSYLNKGGAPIRLRKISNGDGFLFLLSKKARVSEGSIECVEYNIELPEDVYNNLLEAIEGRTIIKTRYNIPLTDGLVLELDVFHGFFEGVCIAEIEYSSIEQANSFVVPEWLGEEVTSLEILANGYMATQANDINEYSYYMTNVKKKNLSL